MPRSPHKWWPVGGAEAPVGPATRTRDTGSRSASRALLAGLVRRLVDLFAECLRPGGLLQDPDVGDAADLGPNRVTNLLQHQKHLRVLLLRKEVQLQVQVTALLTHP